MTAATVTVAFQVQVGQGPLRLETIISAAVAIQIRSRLTGPAVASHRRIIHVAPLLGVLAISFT
jgi:hypothetical protein